MANTALLTGYHDHRHLAINNRHALNNGVVFFVFEIGRYESLVDRELGLLSE